jgi:hypothetical protein
MMKWAGTPRHLKTSLVLFNVLNHRLDLPHPVVTLKKGEHRGAVVVLRQHVLFDNVRQLSHHPSLNGLVEHCPIPLDEVVLFRHFLVFRLAEQNVVLVFQGRAGPNVARLKTPHCSEL